MTTNAKHAVAASSSSAPPEQGAYRQVVAEATVDDDYLCALHPRTMKNLSISHGDVVLLKSKRRREMRCIAASDEECAERKLKINEAVRANLRVRLSDVVFVFACPDAKYVGGRGRLRPVDEAAGGPTKPFKEHRMFNCTFFASLVFALVSVLVLV